jgi:CheY-like chemotaxis protein
LIELVNWLVRAEGLAAAVYAQALRSGAYDDRLSDLLERLSEDEAIHGQLLTSVAQASSDLASRIPAVSIDPATSERLLAPLHAAKRALDAGALPRRQLIEALVDAEYSEWNDIFVYAIVALEQEDSRFEHAAAVMQAHRERLQHFLEQEPASAGLLQKLRDRKSVWQRRLLVVDDHHDIRELLQAILEEYGTVETAADGVEAMSRIRQSYYDVILSDIDMPRMDGLALYNAASVARPEVKASFIFLTGGCDARTQASLEAQGAPVLSKPVLMARLQSVVTERLAMRRPSPAG